MQGSLVGITAEPFCINWGGGATCVAGTTQQMAVSGLSGDFSTAASATDQIKDLTTFGPLPDFETAAGGPTVGGATVNFDLLTLVLPNGGAGFGICSGGAANAANNSCSPAGAPVTLSEDSTGTQVTIAFSALMEAYTGANGSGETPYRGIFTTQYSGELTGAGVCSGMTADITNILNCEAAGGTILSTWSATESPISGVPEPKNTAALVGVGLIGLALCRRRARRA